MFIPARWNSRFVACLVLFLGMVPGAAASDPLAGIAGEDFAALEALSLYPEERRRSILEAATEAHVLTELGTLQERSREHFRQLLEPYDQDAQDRLFQLTRYPALVEGIVDGGPKTSRELEEIAGPYPEDVREAARLAGRDHWKVVARIHALLTSQQVAFEGLVGELPEEKQEAFRELLETPEVLALLTENTAMAVLLGDAYEREPDAVLEAMDALQREVAERNAEEARDFAEGVAEDPELEREVQASYREYEEETTRDVNVNVTVVRPYSWWVGVPWWVPATYVYYDPWVYWYPRPYWRHCGSRFGPRLTIAYGAPHHGFYGWYFGRPLHHHHYPRLSHHILRHHERHGYYGHHRRGDFRGRRHRSHFGAGRHAVGHFAREAERDMPRGFLRDGKDRPLRLAEYGKLRSELDRGHETGRKGRKGGRGGKQHRREDFERVVAERPGDFPGLAKLGKDEKRTWQKQAREQRREAKQEERDERKEVRKEKRNEKKEVRQEKRDERKQAHQEKTQVRQEKRAEKKQVRQEKRAEKKQVRQEKRDEKKQVRQEKRDEKKQVRQEKRAPRQEEARQHRVEKKQARQQRHEVKQEKRTQKKEARQQQRETKQEARQELRTQKKEARQERRDVRREKRADKKARKNSASPAGQQRVGRADKAGRRAWR